MGGSEQVPATGTRSCTSLDADYTWNTASTGGTHNKGRAFLSRGFANPKTL